MPYVSGEFTWTDNKTLAVYNFLHPHDDRLTYDSETSYISFDNKFSFTIASNLSSITFKYGNDQSTKTLTSGSPYYPSGSVILIDAVINDTGLYIIMNRKQYGSGQVCIPIFISDDEKYFIGFKAGQGDAAHNINDATFYNALDSNDTAGYTFGHVAAYSVNPPTLIYTPKAILRNGYFALITNLIDCSNVSLKSTITLNGTNYYCCGGNLAMSL